MVRFSAEIAPEYILRFQRALVESNGRWVRNPVVVGNDLLVQVEFTSLDDYSWFAEKWAEYKTSVVEIDSRPNALQKAFRRLRLFFFGRW